MHWWKQHREKCDKDLGSVNAPDRTDLLYLYLPLYILQDICSLADNYVHTYNNDIVHLEVYYSPIEQRPALENPMLLALLCMTCGKC